MVQQVIGAHTHTCSRLLVPLIFPSRFSSFIVVSSCCQLQEDDLRKSPSRMDSHDVVDVMTVDKAEGDSSGEEEGELRHLPTVPIVDGQDTGERLGLWG